MREIRHLFRANDDEIEDVRLSLLWINIMDDGNWNRTIKNPQT